MRRRGAATLALLLLAIAIGRPGAGQAESPSTVAASFSREKLHRVGDYIRNEIAAGKIPGAVILIQQHGQPVYFESFGLRNVESRRPMTADSIFRLYSMSKPITSVAAMMLYEEGGFELTDPVSSFIPSFRDARVFDGGSDLKAVTVPATEPVRIWHLLTHTSGLTYGFHRAHPVDAMYRAAGFEWDWPAGMDLAQA